MNSKSAKKNNMISPGTKSGDGLGKNPNYPYQSYYFGGRKFSPTGIAN
jgi:hypothetical protein